MTIQVVHSTTDAAGKAAARGINGRYQPSGTR
jgi:hypothetical protein